MGTTYNVSDAGNIDTDGYISIGNGSSATYRVNNVQISTANLSDGSTLADLATNETVTGNWSFTHANGIEVTNDVNAATFTGNGAAITAIAEANITDGTLLARLAATETVTGAWTFNNAGTALTVTGNTSLNGTVVVNDSAADKDFRIEGTTEPNLLFTDANLSRVGIGTGTPSETFEVAYGVGLFRGAISVGASPAGNMNELGTSLNLYGRAGFGLQLGANNNSSTLAAIQINAADTAVIINETGSDRDFRVEGDTSTHLLFTDASVDRVGVNDSAPNELLTVGGVVSLLETTAPSATANYGKLYVKSADNKLYFKDDGGTEFDLTAAAALAATVPVWVKYTIAHTDAPFNTAALTDFVTLFTPGANDVIHGIRIGHSAAFTGGGSTSANVRVGISGNTSKYATPFDVFQAPAAGTYQLSPTFYGEDGATAIIVTATSDVNLSTLTTGSVDIWVLISTAA